MLGLKSMRAKQPRAEEMQLRRVFSIFMNKSTNLMPNQSQFKKSGDNPCLLIFHLNKCMEININYISLSQKLW